MFPGDESFDCFTISPFPERKWGFSMVGCSCVMLLVFVSPKKYWWELVISSRAALMKRPGSEVVLPFRMMDLLSCW